ncbi:MAG: anti-sigma factor [Chloroflexota bacterium]|nr:anti-sigma factor [Chloroflexota bacterium]
MNTHDTPPQPTDCDELRDLISAFALGTTSPDEAARVRTLLPDCSGQPIFIAELRSDLSVLSALDAALLQSVAPIAPPPRVKAALMARIAPPVNHSDSAGGEGAVLPAPPTIVPPTLPLPPTAAIARPAVVPTPRRAWIAFALAAAAALIVTNAFWWSNAQSTRADLDAARGQLSQLYTRQDQVLSLVSDLGARRVGLQSTADSVMRLATLYYNPATDQAALVTDGLPALTSAQTYQLWLIEDGLPQNIGIFAPDATGFGLLTFSLEALGPLAPDASMGISVEPAGGSAQPTSAPIAAAPIAA